MKEKLSEQKEIIVGILRDLRWHCGREWVDRIKDDRIRITELNRGYMKDKGYEIKGEPCRGTICGISRCPLYKRRAERIHAPTAPIMPVGAKYPPQTLQSSLQEKSLFSVA